MAGNNQAIQFPKDSDVNAVWWADYLAVMRSDYCENGAHIFELAEQIHNKIN